MKATADPTPADEPADDAVAWKNTPTIGKPGPKKTKTADSLQAQPNTETDKTKKVEEALTEATKRQQVAETTVTRLKVFFRTCKDSSHGEYPHQLRPVGILVSGTSGQCR